MCGHGRLNFARERAIARDMVDRLSIKTPSIQTPVGHLSGGNQQKVALARWLATDPTVLILDEPTQGVDIGAKAEIHRLMGELAEQGLAILLISSELPEILGMSDRVAVMHGGTVLATLDRAEATQERVLALALVKLGRYWSPWPNAAGFRAPALAIATAVIELPLFGLMALGLWRRRRDPFSLGAPGRTPRTRFHWDTAD